MRLVLAALVALTLLTACGEGAPEPNERLFGVWKHINNEGERLPGAVNFTRSMTFSMTGLKGYEGQKSVDYSGTFAFLRPRVLQVKVTGEHGGVYEGELGYNITDLSGKDRLSLSLPGSVAGGRRAIFER